MGPTAITSEFEPLFIIGYPRSGTTLLLHILRASDEFPDYEFDETHFFSHFYRRYGDLEKSKARHRFYDDFFCSEFFSKSGVTKNRLLQKIGRDKFQYHIYLKTVMEIIAISQNKKRWLEKTPWHILYIEEILNSFPNVKFILVVRDPRGVALSIRNATWARGSAHGFLRTAAAWQWHMKRALQILESRKCEFIVVKFEDLVSKTELVIENVNRFLGTNIRSENIKGGTGVMLNPNSSFSEQFEGISTIPVERWRNRLTENDIATIEYTTKDQMIRYGYPILTKKFDFGLLWKMRVKVFKLAYGLFKSARLLLFPLVRR